MHPKILEEFFRGRLSEALIRAAQQFDFPEIYSSRLRYKETVIQEIGQALNGFVLEDVSIVHLDKTK